MSIRIENATPIHTRETALLFQKVVTPLKYYNETAKTHELAKYSDDELGKKLAEDPYSVLIARESEDIVGFCFSRLDDMTIWLEWFGVSENARQKGVAKMLVQSLELSASVRNAHKIWCDCRTENIKSVNLLSVCGYLPICTLKNHWYRQDFILWQKEIL